MLLTKLIQKSCRKAKRFARNIGLASSVILSSCGTNIEGIIGNTVSGFNRGAFVSELVDIDKEFEPTLEKEIERISSFTPSQVEGINFVLYGEIVEQVEHCKISGW